MITLHDTTAGADTNTSAMQTDSPASARSSRQRIMVVDDNQDAADSMGVLLEQLGVDVRVYYDGVSALSGFTTYRPAVVLLDIGMPGMDGYAVAAQMRKQSEGERLMLIALTGWGQEQDRRRSLANGFDYHLTKPADVELLWSLVRAAIAGGRTAGVDERAREPTA